MASEWVSSSLANRSQIDDVYKRDYRYMASDKENVPARREGEMLILAKDSGKQFTTTSSTHMGGGERWTHAPLWRKRGMSHVSGGDKALNLNPGSHVLKLQYKYQFIYQFIFLNHDGQKVKHRAYLTDCVVTLYFHTALMLKGGPISDCPNTYVDNWKEAIFFLLCSHMSQWYPGRWVILPK